ncbi:MAG: hypothetical protein KF914_03110 [Rhizobiaceae bacterium]|nr:hypothetical protein [Rhizobiaceae bacterium]
MLASLIAGLATGETMAALRRTRSAAIAYLLAAVLLLLGGGFLLLAAFIYAARELGPIGAALWFGGGFVLLGVGVIVGHRIASATRRRVARRQRSRDFTKVAVAAGVALAPALLRSRAGIFALAAPAIAAVVYAIYRENSDGPDGPADDGQ